MKSKTRKLIDAANELNYAYSVGISHLAAELFNEGILPYLIENGYNFVDWCDEEKIIVHQSGDLDIELEHPDYIWDILGIETQTVRQLSYYMPSFNFNQYLSEQNKQTRE